MGFSPQHTGLYIDAAQVAQVQRARQEGDAIVTAAWERLTGAAEAGDFAAVQQDAFRCRFAEDEEAGERAGQALLQAGMPTAETLLEVLVATAGLGHAFELLRDHPALAGRQGAWLGDFAVHIRQLTAPPGEPSPLETLWITALRIIGGVILEDEPLFRRGVEGFQQAVDREIHPQGYIRGAVEASEGTFANQLYSALALTLAAEAARHAGENLWAYENRGVGVNTAVAYLVYYYFYPEQWKWEEGLVEKQTHELFRQRGAFIEIAAYHRTPRGIEALLEDQRPMFDPCGGGYTTLSHARSIRPRRRGLFG